MSARSSSRRKERNRLDHGAALYSTANLEGWLKSNARAALVKESEDLVAGFHAQRVDTSFPGWIPNDPTTGKPPNRWKAAALILLTLFPVVMLELKFLNPHLRELNPAVGTFIGNALSVALTTWPLMPLAIYGFHAWLFPENRPRWLVLTMPVVLVLCYLIEIAFASTALAILFEPGKIGRRIDVGENAVRPDRHFGHALQRAAPSAALAPTSPVSRIISSK